MGKPRTIRPQGADQSEGRLFLRALASGRQPAVHCGSAVRRDAGACRPNCGSVPPRHRKEQRRWDLWDLWPTGSASRRSWWAPACLGNIQIRHSREAARVGSPRASPKDKLRALALDIGSSKSLAVIVRWHWLACLEASSRRRLRGGKDAVRKEETGDGGPFDMANPAAVSRRFTLTTWANRGQKLELQGERRPIHAEVVAERADFGRGARELCKL